MPEKVRTFLVVDVLGKDNGAATWLPCMAFSHHVEQSVTHCFA